MIIWEIFMNCCRGSEAIIDEDVAWNGTAILSSKNYGHKVLILTGIGHADADATPMPMMMI